MSRAELQQLAQDRVEDAQALLAAGRWAGAFHLIGYAAEAGLKSCILAYIERTGNIFKDRKSLDSIKDCWTHDLGKLVDIADLKQELEDTLKANPAFAKFWAVAKELEGNQPLRTEIRGGSPSPF